MNEAIIILTWTWLFTLDHLTLIEMIVIVGQVKSLGGKCLVLGGVNKHLDYNPRSVALGLLTYIQKIIIWECVIKIIKVNQDFKNFCLKRYLLLKNSYGVVIGTNFIIVVFKVLNCIVDIIDQGLTQSVKPIWNTTTQW